MARSRVNNLTIPGGVGDAFGRVWNAVEVQRIAAGAGAALDPTQWARWFAELRQQPGAEAIDVQPLRPRRCSSAARCIGTNGLGECVCYSS